MKRVYFGPNAVGTIYVNGIIWPLWNIHNICKWSMKPEAHFINDNEVFWGVGTLHLVIFSFYGKAYKLKF